MSRDATAGDAAIIVAFPDASIRRALGVLGDENASDLEHALAASVVVVAMRQGVALPAWVLTALGGSEFAVARVDCHVGRGVSKP